MKNINVEKKYLKHGGYSFVMTLVLLVVLVVVNVAVSSKSPIVDLSSNNMFSLSDQSNKILSHLNKKVTIYALFQSGADYTIEKQILKKYTDKSSDIDLIYKDPNLYPQFAAKYITDNGDAPSGSLIIERGNKFKLIRPSDMVNSTTDETTGQSSIKSFIVEQKITNAIAYVSSDVNPVIYQLKGQGEPDLTSTVSSKLNDENFTVKTVDLLTDKLIAAPGSTLLIDGPTRDLSDSAFKAIKNYINDGGNIYFMADLYSTKLKAPNLEALLKLYGVKLLKDMIIEGDSKHMANYPIYLLPDLSYNDITNPLSQAGVKVIMPGLQAIQNIGTNDKSLSYSTLMVTSVSAYGKAEVQPKSVEKAKGDAEGPFDLSATVVKKNSNGKSSKLVVAPNSTFLTDEFIQGSSNANLDFFMNGLSYLSNKKDNISIRPKDITSTTIVMDGFTSILICGFTVIVLPLIVIIFGVVVWLKRRKL